MVELDELKKLALAGGDLTTAQRVDDFICGIGDAGKILDLIERLERAEQKAANAERLGKTILDAKNHWADRAAKAENTLQRLGYTYHGGQLWKPPLGEAPSYITGKSESATSIMLRFDKQRRHPVGGLDHGWLGEYNRGWNDALSAALSGFVGMEPTIDPAFFDTKLGRPYEAACPGSLHDVDAIRGEMDECRLKLLSALEMLDIEPPILGDPRPRAGTEMLVSDDNPRHDAGWATSMIPEGESLQDGLDALVVPVRIHKATDAELDDAMLEQVEASGGSKLPELQLTGGQQPGKASLLACIRAAVDRRRDGGAS